MRFFLVLAAWVAIFSALNVGLRRWVIALGASDWTIQGIFGLVTSPWPWIAAGMYGTCAALYAMALYIAPLSTAGPIYLTAGVVATSLLGWGLFGEVISPLKAIGLLTMFIGIALLALADA